MNTFSSDDPIFGDVKEGDEIPYVPRHMANAMAGVESSRVGVSAAVSYVAAMREVAGNQPLSDTLATDEEFVVDASGYVRLFGTLAIYANVRNIFNNHAILSHRPFGARPNAPRWIQVGARVTF